MRKFIQDLYSFMAHPVTHIVFGLLFLVFAWCMAYEVGYVLDVYSFIIGVVASAGFGCFDLGIQKLLEWKKNK